MKFSCQEQAGRTVVAVEGVLDSLTVPEIRPLVDRLVSERRSSIEVDLRALRLIDSSGVGVIVSLYKQCRAFGGTVQVVGVEGQPLAIFKLLRLDRVFELDAGPER